MSIAPKPLVIEPEFNAPVPARLGIAVISSSKYAARSVTATCFIVPLSLNTTRSASTTVTDEAEVPPSMMLSSAVVLVTPSKRFSSAGVDVMAVLLAAASTGIVPL